jgi:hypothetical protein
MPRHLIVIALLLSMLTRATVFGSPAAGIEGGQAALHSLLHWAGLGHHHHRLPPVPPTSVAVGGADAVESLHVSAVADSAWNSCDQDQSSESTQHLLMDGFVSAAAMLPSWFAALPTGQPRPAPPGDGIERVPATPFLEGLRRPPRLTA